MRETNELIKAYSVTEPQLDFIDVYSAMLGADGQPDGDGVNADIGSWQL